MRRLDTVHLAPRPQNGRNHTTASMAPIGTVTNTPTNHATRENVRQEPLRRPEKKQQQTVDVENDYFTLNPWYNEQNPKPVFGLGAPLPRTVRRGMWWGRGDMRQSLYKIDDQDGGIDHQDAVNLDNGKGKLRYRLGRCTTFLTTVLAVLEEDLENSQETLNGGRQADGPNSTERFQTVVDGRRVNVKRVPTGEAIQVLGGNSDPGTRSHEHHEGQNRAPVNEHGLDYADGRGQQQHFGLQDGLPPLQQRGTNDTSRTEQEEIEIQGRQQQEEREFYNQYRNPIARFRAKYPQAPAEFLAVCRTFLTKIMHLTFHRHSSTCSEDCASTYLLPHLNKPRAVSRHKPGAGALQS